jgi:hypothetical protein
MSTGLENFGGRYGFKSVRFLQMPYIPDPRTSLSELQALFGESSNNPMYDCYPIGADQVGYLQSKLEHAIALDQYDYYLNCRRE